MITDAYGNDLPPSIQALLREVDPSREDWDTIFYRAGLIIGCLSREEIPRDHITFSALLHAAALVARELTDK